MRILVITNLYPNPYQPNRATFNRQQVRALAAKHEIEVIAPILWTDEWSARRKTPTRLPPDRRVECDGLPVLHPRYVYPPKIGRRWYGPCFRRCVRAGFQQALRTFRPEMIFAPWVYPDGWAAVKLGHAAGMPVVLKAHGSDIHTWDTYAGRQDGTMTALREADGIIAVSQDLAQRIAALGADTDRIQVIYDGVDTSRFHAGSKAAARQKLDLTPDIPLILFIGNLVQVKGLDVLLRAYAQLAESRRPFVAALIGGGPLNTPLQKLTANLGLSGRVRFLGPRPHDELPDWYRAANVFVLPSRSEGIPVVLLEAAACGTPFVASRVGGIPEIASSADSELVTPGDANELAAALARRLDTPAGNRPSSTFSRKHDDAASELSNFFEQVRSRHVSLSSPPATLYTSQVR
ncbi:MAG TPA: glycosyltransferase family 4 protein [Gemmataceae bacterium]|nr:glycosyltransferase family 4 protein [Gemmataceae bacterium]